MDTAIQTRLKDLEENVLQDLELLKAYEDEERYAHDPRELARIRREIVRQRDSAKRYNKEYDDLRKQVASEPPEKVTGFADRLEHIEDMLTELQSGQRAMADQLVDLRQTMLQSFNASEQRIISSLINELNQNQLETVKCIWDALEANCISEQDMRDTLEALQKVVADIMKNKAVDPKILEQTEKISKILDDPAVGSSHKLKLTIPIIPLILSYEGEIELKVGMNLQSAWEALKAKFGRGHGSESD